VGSSIRRTCRITRWCKQHILHLTLATHTLAFQLHLTSAFLWSFESPSVALPCLFSWSSSSSASTSSIDFSLTAVEVRHVDDSASRFIILPADGQSWSKKDNHRSAGKRRAFIFDVHGSCFPRWRWIEALNLHIEYGYTMGYLEYSLINTMIIQHALKPYNIWNLITVN